MGDYYNINGSHLTFVSYEEPRPEPKGPVVKEPMIDILEQNYAKATGKTPDTSVTSSTQAYDMDPNGVILNYPVGHPKYQPSFMDTRIQDAQAMQQQGNTLFMLGTVAGLSLIVLSFMIYKRQTSE